MNEISPPIRNSAIGDPGGRGGIACETDVVIGPVDTIDIAIRSSVSLEQLRANDDVD